MADSLDLQYIADTLQEATERVACDCGSECSGECLAAALLESYRLILEHARIPGWDTAPLRPRMGYRYEVQTDSGDTFYGGWAWCNGPGWTDEATGQFRNDGRYWRIRYRVANA